MITSIPFSLIIILFNFMLHLFNKSSVESQNGVITSQPCRRPLSIIDVQGGGGGGGRLGAVLQPPPPNFPNSYFRAKNYVIFGQLTSAPPPPPPYETGPVRLCFRCSKYRICIWRQLAPFWFSTEVRRTAFYKLLN